MSHCSEAAKNIKTAASFKRMMLITYVIYVNNVNYARHSNNVILIILSNYITT